MILFSDFSVCGSDASVEWESEGRRVVPLMPRLVPQTAFTGCATAAANHAANVNSTIPSTLKGLLSHNVHYLSLLYNLLHKLKDV